MGNITSPTISLSDPCYASVVSDAFAEIESQLTQMNSANYGVSAVMSRHISVNAILSQHISDSQVVGVKISDTAILEANMNYASTDGGARFLRIGEGSASMPANGVVQGRYSATVDITSNAASLAVWPVTVYMSAGIDGNPGFTGTPTVGEAVLQIPSAITTNTRVVSPGANAGVLKIDIGALDSDSAVLLIQYGQSLAATDTHNATVYFAAEGPK